MGKTVGNLDKHIQIDLSNFSVNGHTHNYVPLSGGTMTGNLKFSDVTSTTYPAKSAMLTWNGSTDGADIYYQVDASDKGRLVLNTRDDSDCVIAFANKGAIKTTIDANGNFSGNAATATKLQTARSISLGGVLSGSASFDGSANASISASIAKPPKSGDWFSGGIPTVATDGVMEIGKYIDFHNTDASTNDYDVRLQANTSTPCVITLPTAAGTLARTADNVASATKLQTARTINGTTFDGSANITTANWGTARTLTIGNKGQSVNGSGNITWSTNDILGNATSLGKDSDWNTANATGVYEASGFNESGATGANRPVGAYSWGGVLTLRHKNVTNQIYLSHSQNQMWIRGGWNGSFNTSWARVYTTDYKPTYSDVGAAAASHGTHVTYATATPKANGTAAIGSVNRVAREDHVHPLQASAATWTTARTLTIGNKGQSVNGSANVSWSLADIGAVETVAWDTSIKCATWSRLFQYSATNATIGGAFLVNIQATRGNVVYGPTVLVNFGHSTTCNIVQINNISYTNIKIRGVVNSNGAGYLEIYDNANSATNSTTQSVTVSVTKLTKGLSITKYTTFTDGSTIPTNYASKGEITTVSGCYYTGKAATSGNADTATKLKTARTLTIGNTGKTFDGSANVSWTLAEIGALPTAGGTMTGILTIGPVAYDSAYTKAGTFTDTNVKRSMIKFAQVSGSNDPGAIYLESSATTADINKGVLHLCPSDDGTNDGTDYVSIHGTNDAENIKLHTGGAASFASTVTAPTFSGALSGNAATATKLVTARKINGTSFNGTADITTANWGTSRKINQISVNGSADVKLPLDYYTCTIGSSNTKPYHHILATGQCTGSYTDKSITIVLVNHYNGAGLGIAKATLRTNNATNGGTAYGELRWLVRSGFAENQLCFNIRNTAKDAYMDVFYKSGGSYASLTWYVLTEGFRGNHSSQWTKYNTHHDNGTNVYDEAGMKAIRTYTSTLQSATDHGNVNYAKSANTATSATTASGANALNSNTRMDYGWNGLNYFNISGTAGKAAKVNDTPTTAWWHIIRCNHANSAGFYTDIAVPFNATSMYYKRVTSGAVQNGGWVKVLDSLNYSSYALPLSGGTLTGNLTMTDGKKIQLSTNTNHTKAAIGVESSTGDVYISNINSNWFRIKPDKTMTIGGSKVYSALDKPTPAEIGAEVATATHSTVDLNTSGFSSSGTKTADTMASTGNCYSFTSTTTATKLAAGNFNAVKFGKYALCLRVKSSNNTSTATLLTVTVKHGSTTLLTKNIKGTDFTSTSQYSNIYTSFDFNGTSSARGTLSIQVNTGTTSGITLRFDYAYITLMTPSVFI